MMMKKPGVKPPIITIIASPGVGKTSLAGHFNKPVFIQAEDSETVFEQWEDDVKPLFMDRLPRSNKAKGLWTKQVLLEQLRWLATNDHDRETCVIDTTSTLNREFETQLCQEYDVDNVADAAGGFFKGYIAAAEYHGEVVSACEALRKIKNMTIVFLSHQGIQKIKSSPDAEEYTVYSLDMPERAAQIYISRSDCVFYIRKDVIIVGREVDRKGRVTKYGKALDNGQRQLITSGDGRFGYAYAKSRYSIPDELTFELGSNPIVQYIPFFNKEN